MRTLILAIAATGAAGSVSAACPPNPDVSAELQSLAARVQAAPDERSAREITTRMWELWTRAPDERAQELLDQGMSRRAAYDFTGAVAALDELVAYCPDYAEGYNQRAFVNFLRGDMRAAMEDLEIALAITPDHSGALSGKALTLMGMGQVDEGQNVLREALRLNPWLPERGMLIEPLGEEL